MTSTSRFCGHRQHESDDGECVHESTSQQITAVTTENKNTDHADGHIYDSTKQVYAPFCIINDVHRRRFLSVEYSDFLVGRHLRHSRCY